VRAILLGNCDADIDVCSTDDGGWLTADVPVAAGGKRQPLRLRWWDRAGKLLHTKADIFTGTDEGGNYPRLAPVGGYIALAHHAMFDGKYQATLRRIYPDRTVVTDPDLPVLGEALGSMALSGDWFAWQDTNHQTWGRRLTVPLGPQTLLRPETRPTGLSRMDGSWPRFVDEDRALVPGMLNPVQRYGIVVGEKPDAPGEPNGGIVVRTGEGQPQGILLKGENTPTPRGARAGADMAAVHWGANARLILFTAADLQVPVPPQTDIAPIGRSMWGGFFAGQPNSGVWSTDTDPRSLPGNSWLTIPDSRWITRDGKTIGQYVSGTPDGDVDAIDRAIVKAKAASPLPVVAYWPAAAWSRVPAGADFVGVEAYRRVDESVEAFEARVRGAVARCPAVVLIPQCYTSNANNTTDLYSIVPVTSRIARDCQNVYGILTFNGSGRATGLQNHPEMVAPWTELFAGIV
jgi:hypothetical protein